MKYDNLITLNKSNRPIKLNENSFEKFNLQNIAENSVQKDHSNENKSNNFKSSSFETSSKALMSFAEFMDLPDLDENSLDLPEMNEDVLENSIKNTKP